MQCYDSLIEADPLQVLGKRPRKAVELAIMSSRQLIPDALSAEGLAHMRKYSHATYRILQLWQSWAEMYEVARKTLHWHDVSRFELARQEVSVQYGRAEAMRRSYATTQEAHAARVRLWHEERSSQRAAVEAEEELLRHGPPVCGGGRRMTDKPGLQQSFLREHAAFLKHVAKTERPLRREILFRELGTQARSRAAVRGAHDNGTW